MFHGRSLWPSIKGTESNSCEAASSLSSKGAPSNRNKARAEGEDEVAMDEYKYYFNYVPRSEYCNYLLAVTRRASGTATPAAPAMSRMDVKANQCLEGISQPM